MARPLKITLFLAIVLTLSACAGTGSYFAPVAAVVDGLEITERRIASDFALAVDDPQTAELFEGPEGDANRLDAYRQVLGDLIRQAMLIQEAEKREITVPDEDVLAQLDATAEGYGGMDIFLDELKRIGVSLDYVETRFREQALFEMVTSAIASEVTVTEAEVREAYEANKEAFSDQRRLSHVLICQNFDPSAARCDHADSDLQTARDVVARARDGEDFAALAQQFSADPSGAQNGGDLGWATRGQFVPAFEEVAYALESPGDVSDPVETEFGYHVILLVEIGRPEAEALALVEDNLLGPRREQAIEGWLRESLQGAEIRINPRYGRFDSATLSVVAVE